MTAPLIFQPMFDSWDVYEGATFSRTYEVGAEIDLVGATVRWMARANLSDDAPVVYLFRDSGITVDDIGKRIDILLSPQNTSDLFDGLPRGWGEMGLEIATRSGDSIPYMQGKIRTYRRPVR